MKEKCPRKEILDPVSRYTEILFGLIMVLTFTCSLSAIDAGVGDVREMLIAALGCNIAWGIIDAFFYVMGEAAERGRQRILVRQLSECQDQGIARALIEPFVPESILGSLTEESFSQIREHLLASRDSNTGPITTFSDWKAAGAIFFLVFLTTFPVAIPFLLFSEIQPALRISNAIALALLFGVGYPLGKYAGRRPIVWGTSMAVIGSLLVAITMALGG